MMKCELNGMEARIPGLLFSEYLPRHTGSPIWGE